MHRAANLAEIEAREGAFATFFVNPHCSFYNLLEPAVTARARRIAALGHEIGLHFDSGAYGQVTWSAEALEQAVDRERRLMEMILEISIRSVSWHNPDMSNLLEFDAEEIAGLQNAYSLRMREQYTYCSDSNGYWRFKPMSEVIAEDHPRLHLLTHPGWWLEMAMPASERIDRAILGRARDVRRDYDQDLAQAVSYFQVALVPFAPVRDQVPRTCGYQGVELYDSEDRSVYERAVRSRSASLCRSQGRTISLIRWRCHAKSCELNWWATRICVIVDSPRGATLRELLDQAFGKNQKPPHV